MTYEEKLEKIISKLKEERDLTRKGRTSKLTLDDNSFTKVRIREICKILLQLQDDEGIVKINDALQPLETIPTEQIVNPTDHDDYEGVEIISIEFGEDFDNWYSSYLIRQKSTLTEITYLNLLKILHTLLDVKETVQIRKDSTIIIPILPQRIRFRELFLADDVGQRDEFIQGRWDALGYLKKENVIKDFRLIDRMLHRWDNDIEVTINPELFYPFYEKVKQEVSKRLEAKEQKQETPEIEHEQTTDIKNITPWPDNFKKEGKTFVFGQYGKLDLQSSDRIRILQVLFEKKGGWATINELKGTQSAGFVRSTIKQIEDRFTEEVKKHIKIISTQEDDSGNKPASGAYKIVVS